MGENKGETMPRITRERKLKFERKCPLNSEDFAHGIADTVFCTNVRVKHGSDLKFGKARRFSDDLSEGFEIFKIVAPATPRESSKHRRREFPRSRRFRNYGGNAPAIAELP